MIMDIMKFLNKIRSGYQLVQGCRFPSGGGKIEKGAINGTLGIYISDRVEGKILSKLHLKETDLLFNLNGYNVFNLATLNDAYRKLEDKKEIVASIYRNGKIKKIIARRIDAS